MLALVWGSAFFYIEIALQYAGPLTIVLTRVAGGAAALILYCRARRTPLTLPFTQQAHLAVMALLASVVPFSLIAYGQINIASGLTAILIAATPLFTVVIGHVWWRTEPATTHKIAGVVIGFAGVAVLMGADLAAGLSDSLHGQTAIMAAAFSYAISALYGRRFRELQPSVTATWMLGLASLMMTPLVIWLEAPQFRMPPGDGLAALAALALLSTAVAYLLYFRILGNAGATNAMLVTFVQPPIAIMLGALFLGETLKLHQLVGMALIFVGLMLVDGRVMRLAFRRV